MTGKLERLVEDLKAVKVATKVNRFRLILMVFWANAKSASEHNYSNAPSQTAKQQYHMWVGPQANFGLLSIWEKMSHKTGPFRRSHANLH